MKKYFLLFFIILTSSFIYAQKVEKIGEIKEIRYRESIGGAPDSPNLIAVNEVENIIKINNGSTDFTYFDLNTLKGIKELEYQSTYETNQIELNGIDINYSASSLTIEKNNTLIKNIIESNNSGICFILKKDNGYIVYVNTGYPYAIDTNGRTYSEDEAMLYLKKYDSEKYEQSKKRATELNLYNDFIHNNVLIWGNTYYTTTEIMEWFYKEADPYIFNGLIQYDNLGYGYQIDFNYNRFPSDVCIVNPDGTRNIIFNIRDYSTILSTYEDGENRKYFVTGWHVGFGGNIYYYIAGEEYTEVFRIRRTWGEPDFYAMAINGYTDDSYGKYVNKVLPTLSKADLRLLRNTIFALYGVHFKSADLSKLFNKQVWYKDEGKTSADVTLPEHRQKLVEMILKLEK